MSESGTLLSELGNARPSDEDLVDSILADVNQLSGPGQPSGRNPVMNTPPPAGVRMPMQQVAPMQQTYPMAADPAVPTAHMIGRDHPTPADFQQMMMSAQGPAPYSSSSSQMEQRPSKKRSKRYDDDDEPSESKWVQELKQPAFIAILVFLVTLPAVNLLFNHYAPSLLRPGGDFTTVGNAVRAVLAGGLYFLFQRVIAPLLSI